LANIYIKIINFSFLAKIFLKMTQNFNQEAIIFCPAKNAMQSGKANCQKWVVKILPQQNYQSINPLMGWVSSNNTQMQLKFAFSSKEQAINFAKSKQFNYKIIAENKIIH